MHLTRSPGSDVRREPRSSCLPCSSSGQRVLPRGHTVLLEETSDAAGPVAGVLAMAYKPDLRNPKAMDIQPDGSGKMIHSIPLDDLGLVLQIIN